MSQNITVVHGHCLQHCAASLECQVITNVHIPVVTESHVTQVLILKGCNLEYLKMLLCAPAKCILL